MTTWRRRRTAPVAAMLAGLGLILFATTFLLNAAARVLVNAVQRGPKRATG